MGLFDDIVDVYTGSKTKKQVSSNPSTKPQSPPGQKVSGPHVFQVKRLEQKKPRKVTVGYGTMQVDPGLASAIFQKKYKNKKTGEKITKREADALAQSQFLPGEGGFNVTYPDPIKPIIKKDDKEDKDDKDDKEDISTQIMNRIMRKGDHVSDPFSTTKKSWEDAGMVPLGQHKLRTQYDRLLAKYGPEWGKTTQAKERLAYLAGVPVERGGFLGGRDPNYGAFGKGIKEFQNKLLLNDDFMDAENYRRRVLNQFGGIGNLERAEGTFQTSDFLKGLDIEKLKLGLTPEQYFNFRQQLMAADPTPGNLVYKGAFPYSSGHAVTKLMTPVASSIKDLFGIKDKQHPEYRGEALDPALINALKERGGILDPFARDESTQELAYGNYGWGGGGTDTDADTDTDTDPDPGTGNQWDTAEAGQIGFYNPVTGQYEYGTMPDYLRFAQVKDGGIIGLDGGGYLDDYRAADSLMFNDPHEDEEWEYYV